jgi:hypothetical protein
MFNLLKTINIFCKVASINISLKESHDILTDNMLRMLYLIEQPNREAMLKIILNIKDDLISYPGISQDDPTQITFFNQAQNDFDPRKNEKDYKKRTTSTLVRYLVKKYKVLNLGITEKELKLFVHGVNTKIEESYNLLNKNKIPPSKTHPTFSIY